MKKAFAILLSVVMLAGLCMPVMAQTENQVSVKSESLFENNIDGTSPVLDAGGNDDTPVNENGLNEEDGNLVYYVDGVRQDTTDVIFIDGSWYNLVNGVVTPDTVAKNKSGWWYIDADGKVDFTFAGFASNAYGTWFCKNGKVQFVTDVIKTTYNGIAGWYYIKNGKLTAGPTVAKNSNGWWYIDANGEVDFTFTGFASNAYGTWYCRNGRVTFTDTGVISGKYQEETVWGHVVNSKLIAGPDVQNNQYGWWYIDQNGFVDFTANTVARNSYGWWYIKNGKVDFYYTGVAHNDYGWWRIEGGKVNFDFSGVASNSNGSWVLQNGKVDFTLNGSYTWQDVTYGVSGGKVINSNDWVASLNAALTYPQLFVTAGNTSGSNAVSSLHTKDANGIWIQNFKVDSHVGTNGLTTSKVEGDKKSPCGIYHIIKAFGNKADPGCSAMSYLKVDSSYHWVEDSNSPYYNKMISTNTVSRSSFGESEQIVNFGYLYNYVLATSYNESCVPGKGSAIFVHCTSGKGTGGCVSIPESYMVQYVRMLKSSCGVIIDYSNKISNY